MHESTFEYLVPSARQMESLKRVRAAAQAFAKVLAKELPAGDDRTHAIRTHRTATMWASVAITRNDDGSPRKARGAPRKQKQA